MYRAILAGLSVCALAACTSGGDVSSHTAAPTPPGGTQSPALVASVKTLTDALNRTDARGLTQGLVAPVAAAGIDAALPAGTTVKADLDHSVVVGDTAQIAVVVSGSGPSSGSWLLLMVHVGNRWQAYGTVRR